MYIVILMSVLKGKRYKAVITLIVKYTLQEMLFSGFTSNTVLIFFFNLVVLEQFI